MESEHAACPPPLLRFPKRNGNMGKVEANLPTISTALVTTNGRQHPSLPTAASSHTVSPHLDMWLYCRGLKGRERPTSSPQGQPWFGVYLRVFLIVGPTNGQSGPPPFPLCAAPALPTYMENPYLCFLKGKQGETGGKKTAQKGCLNSCFTDISPGCLLFFTFQLQKCCECYTGSAGHLPEYPGEQQGHRAL